MIDLLTFYILNEFLYSIFISSNMIISNQIIFFCYSHLNFDDPIPVGHKDNIINNHLLSRNKRREDTTVMAIRRKIKVINGSLSSMEAA